MLENLQACFFLWNHWLISRKLHFERCNRKYKSVEMDQVWIEKMHICAVCSLLGNALTKWMNQGNHQIDCNSKWNSGVLAANFSSPYYDPFKQCAKHWKYNLVLQIKHLFFVAFCSFFPCSLTVFHRGRQQKSMGRQWKSSRADKQNCFP